MRKYNTVLYSLALLKFILPYILQNSYYEPHRDEFLYLAEGSHMAWGFMEVPPMLSVFAWLTHLLGDGMFWIKCWPSLIGACTFIVTGRIILSLGGKTFALVLCFLGFFYSGYLRVHFLFQPNFLEVFFWTMMAYGIIRYIQANKTSWLYVTGICAGLGMMSKYSALFFIVSLIAGIALTRHRKMLVNKHFWFAAITGFIIFLPNVIWQYNRHFPVLHHMAELNETQLQYVSHKSFITDQFMMFLPTVFLWVTGFIFAAFLKEGKPYRFYAFTYVFVIAILLALHGKNYYSLGTYPVLIAFGSYQLGKATEVRLKFLRYVLVIIPLLLTLNFVPIALPVLKPEPLAKLYRETNAKATGALHWEDLKDHPLPQDFSDMLGWEEMARKTASAWNALDSNEKKHAIIYCDNYGQAGAVSFYAKKYHMPFAYSDNASFLYWMPEDLRFDNVVLVTDDEHEMEHPFVKDFASAQLRDSVTSTYSREHGSLIILFKGANEAFNQMFKEKLAKARADLLNKPQ
ncbi:MAG TPA: glycosyltransferase family 39 protein [Chitinophagaceae bacterium]|nr:glycosyltransferase family 39 protein [Chitinophagaceae bacterium]